MPPDYDYQQTAHSFRRFLCGTENVILVCPANLAPAAQGKLVVLPLRLQGTVAAPCRAVLMFED